jgi:hypothetical protein
VGGRRQYQAKMEEKEKPVAVAPIKEEAKAEEPIAKVEEEDHEEEKPKRGRKQ